MWAVGPETCECSDKADPDTQITLSPSYHHPMLQPTKARSTTRLTYISLTLMPPLPQALAIMAQPAYIPPSLTELARLADEIWFLAGDTSVDTSWYTKRATLAAVYSSTELFMTTDTSPEHMETERFLDRRLEETRRVGGVVRDVGQWVGFSGASVLNVLRSKGVRV